MWIRTTKGLHDLTGQRVFIGRDTGEKYPRWELRCQPMVPDMYDNGEHMEDRPYMVLVRALDHDAEKGYAFIEELLSRASAGLSAGQTLQDFRAAERTHAEQYQARLNEDGDQPVEGGDQ